MTDLVFCYHCRRYHPIDEVVRVQSRGVKRWRCLKSIALGQNSRVQRDAFGKSVSDMNKANRQRSLPHCVRELFGYVPEEIVSPA